MGKEWERVKVWLCASETTPCTSNTPVSLSEHTPSPLLLHPGPPRAVPELSIQEPCQRRGEVKFESPTPLFGAPEFPE